ncbi:MAG: MFS transporter [Armatimonadota bacterium]|nr:MFS transporter [Armatimonadota bacterium]
MTVRTLALGLGALATQLTWATYNVYLPLLYGRFVESNARIGLVMVLDDATAVLLGPWFATLSDRTATGWGRRIPFLAAGMPLAALCFSLIPRATGLGPLLAATALMNLALAAAAAPMMALMPDITPQPYRGRATGIINALAGCGAMLAFFALAPASRILPTLPFHGASLAMLAALAAIVLTIRERRDAVAGRAEARCPRPGGSGWWRGVVAVGREVRRHRALLLLAVLGFCAVAALNGVQNMFTRFGVHRLGLDAAGAAGLLGVFVLTFIAAAVPAGAVGDRFGRVRALRAGLAGTVGAFLLAHAAQAPGPLTAALLLGGLAWALFLTNAYPVLLELIPARRVGLYSGLWGATGALGGLVAPPLYGWVVDRWGFGVFFVPGVALTVLALACGLALGGAAARQP